MKHLPIFLITFTLLLTAIPLSPIETARSDAPYIQYYSPRHDAFIIERANGTDSRLFGKKWIDEEARGMTNGAWSPSGEWYAFISTKYVDRWLRGQDAVVVDISDTRTLTVLQQIEHEPDFVQWFEEDDVLLISTIKGFPSDYPFERYFYVIDAATDSMLATFMLRPQEPWMCCTVWSSAFQSFSIYFQNFADQTEFLYLVDASGDVREPSKPDGFFYETAPSGWMVVNNSGIKFLENIFTRERIHAVVPFSSVRFYEHFAVLCDCILPGDDCLLNLQSQELIPVPSGFNVMFGDEPIIRNESQIIVWNDAFEVFLMDIATREMTPTGVAALPNQHILPQSFWDLPPVYWNDNAGLVIREQIPETITIIKDGVSKRITFPFSLSFSPMKLSSDGEWIGNVSIGANTYNLKENVAYSHQPHSRSVLSIPGGDIIWHPEQNWLIARRVSYIAGGDDKFRLLNMASADGSFNRELPFMCANYETGCIDWLPERVDIDRLPEGRPESYLEQPEIPPAIEIYHGEFVNVINWSKDGQYLQAAYTVPRMQLL
jgi:hypothetical protein